MYAKQNKLSRFSALFLALVFALTLVPGGTLTARASEIEPPEAQLADGVPEFVAGIVPEEFELTYPTPPRTLRGSAADASYDAREGNLISSVKNQGSNGLCWVFGAYAAVEANMLKNGYGEHDLSELHAGYATSYTSGNTAQGFPRSPSDGGNRSHVSAYLMRGTDLSGTVDEIDDPYQTSLLSTRALQITRSKPRNFTVKNILFLSGGVKTDITPGAIKSAIIQYSSVSSSMYWDGTATADAGFGGTTYYNFANSAYYFDNSFEGHVAGATNHLVSIVGWDDNYSVDNFNAWKRPSSQGAWLVKNSWSANWGDDGYMWISYEDTNFPLTVFTVDGVDYYDENQSVYEDDYLGMNYTLGYGSSTTYYSEVFQVENAAEELTQVKVSVASPNTVISVYAVPAYTGTPSLTSASAQSPAATKSCTYPGWYTLDLATPVALGNAGSSFAVVVKLTSTDPRIGMHHVPSDNSPNSNHVSTNGTSWTLLQADWNLNIKAVTTTNGDAVISLAVAAIEGASYVTTQAATPDEAAAKRYIEGAIAGLGTATTNTVEKVLYMAPISGVFGNATGTYGSYVFTVAIGKGAGTAQTTAERTLTIIPTPYDAANDSAAVSSVRTAIENATYVTSQAATPDEAAAKRYIEDIIAGLGATTTNIVGKISYTAPNIGVVSNTTGIYGSYVFIVSISKDAGATQITEERTLTIVPTRYILPGNP